MTNKVYTIEDERLDQCAERHYGTEKDGTVEALLNENQGLADIAAKLPDEKPLNAPQVTVKDTSKIYIWD